MKPQFCICDGLLSRGIRGAIGDRVKGSTVRSASVVPPLSFSVEHGCDSYYDSDALPYLLLWGVKYEDVDLRLIVGNASTPYIRDINHGQTVGGEWVNIQRQEAWGRGGGA